MDVHTSVKHVLRRLAMAKYKKKPEKMTQREKELEKLKYEVAEELGLEEKIQTKGWENMTARETGKVGGQMSRVLRRNDKDRDKKSKK
jgi:small acid-soluble spore protein F (minor alpha/beta-type SASP)